MQRAYRHSTRLFGVLMVMLGTTMAVVALARGAGPLSYGVIVGVLFATLGAARFHLAASPRDGR